jgi:hypothetical protein
MHDESGRVVGSSRKAVAMARAQSLAVLYEASCRWALAGSSKKYERSSPSSTCERFPDSDLRQRPDRQHRHRDDGREPPTQQHRQPSLPITPPSILAHHAPAIGR